MATAKTVDKYLKDKKPWTAGLAELREILLEQGLEETVKWGAPVYCLDGKNVVGMGAFKSYFGLWFFQGALLKDTKKVLVNAQDGKTKALRQWRFGDAGEIDRKRVVAYVKEAIRNEKKGLAIAPARAKKLAVPDELAAALAGDEKARAAFDQLTPGKQREYADHIADAKREDTRLRRVEKALPLIRAGVGLHDKYRDCGR